MNESLSLGSQMGPLRSAVGFIGEQIIYGLIRIFGRRVSVADAAWLKGPLGGDYIGDQPYDDCARQEGLTVQRESQQGGLIEDFDRLGGPDFDRSPGGAQRVIGGGGIRGMRPVQDRSAMGGGFEWGLAALVDQ